MCEEWQFGCRSMADKDMEVGGESLELFTAFKQGCMDYPWNEVLLSNLPLFQVRYQRS